MRNKLFFILSVFLTSMLLFTPVLAGSRIQKIFFEVDQVGNLTVRGTITGLGNQEVIARLKASGLARVSCFNQDGVLEPNKGYTFLVDGATSETIIGGDRGIEVAILKSGINYENECPNDNWSTEIDFIFWTDATISVLDRDTREVLNQYDYVCTAIRDTYTYNACTPVNPLG